MVVSHLAPLSEQSRCQCEQELQMNETGCHCKDILRKAHICQWHCPSSLTLPLAVDATFNPLGGKEDADQWTARTDPRFYSQM